MQHFPYSGSPPPPHSPELPIDFLIYVNTWTFLITALYITWRVIINYPGVLFLLLLPLSERQHGKQETFAEWHRWCVCPIVGSESSEHKSQFKRSSVPVIHFACWLGTMAISAILVPGHTQVLECQRGPWVGVPCPPPKDRGGSLNTDLGQTPGWSHRCLIKSKRSLCPSQGSQVSFTPSSLSPWEGAPGADILTPPSSLF